MCGRTALTATPEDLCRTFGLEQAPALTPHYNIAPSQPLATVRVLRGQPGRTLELLRWGLVPSWAKDPKIASKLALARIETVTTAPAFREAVRKRRCLVVVDGFYEWRREGKRDAQPFFIRRPNAEPFALAGLWERWSPQPAGPDIESCAIVTQPSRPPVDAIHPRMPLVLEPEAWEGWLDPALVDVDRLTAWLTPRAPELVAYPVSRYANDPRHDDPACLTRGPEQLGLL